MFSSIIDSTAGLTGESAFICTLTSAVLGLIAALLYRLNNPRPSKNLMVTLVVLPVLVQSVIMLVNGSVGAGLAVMGAFNLVRFRSAPGTSRELCYVFYAMGIGLATGMGYIGLAVIFFVIVALVMLGLTMLHFGQGNAAGRILKITIPENLDYEGLFDDLFEKYLKSYSLDKIKTSNMGTLFELQYQITLKDDVLPKKFFDELRCRNGNLNIICSKEADRDLL